VNLLRQIAGLVCILAFYVLIPTCAISGICAFGLTLATHVAPAFAGSDIIFTKWAANVAGHSFLVFFISAVLMIAFGYSLQRLGCFQEKKRETSGTTSQKAARR
jgi:hypothetical protein